jgi:hypothetical protein
VDKDDSTFNPYAALHTNETGKYQDQVKALIEKTASSLDDIALKMLFVSVQQNNVDLCIRYAIFEYGMLSNNWTDLTSTSFSLANEIEHLDTVCPRHPDPNDCVGLNSIQGEMARHTMLWFGHSFVSEHSIHWAGYSFFME